MLRLLPPQVFTRGQRGDEGARTRGGALGLGLLMGAATFSFGVERGCRKAEILAINGAGCCTFRLHFSEAVQCSRLPNTFAVGHCPACAPKHSVALCLLRP